MNRTESNPDYQPDLFCSNEDYGAALSESGTQRKQMMLCALNERVRAMPGKRRLRRFGVVLTMVACMIGGIQMYQTTKTEGGWYKGHSGHKAGQMVDVDHGTNPTVLDGGKNKNGGQAKRRPEPVPGSFSVSNVVVNNDPTVSDRFVVRSVPVDQLDIVVDYFAADDLAGFRQALKQSNDGFSVGLVDGRIVMLTSQ